MEDIIEKIALKVVQIGTDKTNFRILEMVSNGDDNIYVHIVQE